MFPRHCLQALALPAAVLLAGCCSTGGREVRYVGPPVTQPPCNRCGPAVGAVPAVVPAPAPAAVPAPPPGSVVLPPSAAAIPATPAPGQVVQGSYTPSPQTAEPRPATQEAIVRLAPPELSAPGPKAQSPERPPVKEPPPAVAEQRQPPPAAPIDIPQFATARANVANGLQPFPDGIAWLKEHGYRTVLHVRAPGTDDAAARRQFEKYGLRYIGFDAQPQTLTKEAVDNFNRIVTDESNLPLFVYDKDGAMTGGLWYLHYRIMEGWTDEKARTETAKLGFRQEQDDRHRTVWLAVQKLLEANGR